MYKDAYWTPYSVNPCTTQPMRHLAACHRFTGHYDPQNYISQANISQAMIVE